MKPLLPRGVSREAAMLGIRLLVCSIAVLFIVSSVSRDAVNALLPAFALILELVADDFKVLRFGFVNERGNESLVLMALLKQTLFFDTKLVLPDGRTMLMAGVTLGTVLLPLQVVLAASLAWPGSWRELLLRLGVALVLVAGVLLVDTPLTLAAWLWDGQLRAHAPDQRSFLVWWSTFLTGGGRLSLSIAAAATAIVLGRCLSEILLKREPQSDRS